MARTEIRERPVPVGVMSSFRRDPWGLTYDQLACSDNMPVDGVLTPGEENIAGGTEGDLDGDGLPDGWEREVCGHTGLTADGDYDGDRVSNWGEYVAGTHAGNSNSLFKVDPEPFAGSEFVISWQAVTGRSYTVEYCDSLCTGQWVSIVGAEDISVTGNRTCTITNPASASDFRMYRVTVELR